MDSTTATLLGALITGFCSLFTVALSRHGRWVRGLLTGLIASGLTAVAMVVYFNFTRPVTAIERNVGAWNSEWESFIGSPLGPGTGTTRIRIDESGVRRQVAGSFRIVVLPTGVPLEGNLVGRLNENAAAIDGTWQTTNGQSGCFSFQLNDDRKSFTGHYADPSADPVSGGRRYRLGCGSDVWAGRGR